MKDFKIINAPEDYSGNSKENIRIALDLNNTYLGSGYVYLNINTDVSKVHPVNIFIDINMANEADLGNIVSLELFHQLKTRAIEIKNQYPEYQSFLYYACLKERPMKLDFFKSNGLIQEETVMLLELDLKKYQYTNDFLEDISIEENQMNDEDALDKVISLHNSILFTPMDKESMDSFNQLMGAKHFTAYHHDDVIGHIMVYIEKDIDGNRIGIIKNLFIEKSWRNKKIAKKLVDAAIMYFKIKNIGNVQLEVWSINKTAIDFYQKLGFEFVQTNEIYVGETI